MWSPRVFFSKACDISRITSKYSAHHGCVPGVILTTRRARAANGDRIFRCARSAAPRLMSICKVSPKTKFTIPPASRKSCVSPTVNTGKSLIGLRIAPYFFASSRPMKRIWHARACSVVFTDRTSTCLLFGITSFVNSWSEFPKSTSANRHRCIGA
jgi:hypothetical protein